MNLDSSEAISVRYIFKDLYPEVNVHPHEGVFLLKEGHLMGMPDRGIINQVDTSQRLSNLAYANMDPRWVWF